MDYPIYIDGEACGVLTETREGLYCVLRAVCPMREGLCRLWVFGGGKSAYLGALAPAGGRLALARRLSRAGRASLPETIAYAANGEIALFCHSEERSDEESPMSDGGEPSSGDALLGMTGAGDAGDRKGRPYDVSEDAGDREDDLLWFTRPDGTLTCFDGTAHYVALPAELRHGDAQGHLREIGGRKYLVFRR